jgi:5-formyltetrahydrofolate cyclo-ligase
MTAQAGGATLSLRRRTRRMADSGPSTVEDRGVIRRAMRAARRRLTPKERALAARRFARIMSRARLLRPGMRVAIYQAYGHEADASKVIELARSQQAIIYLPVITHFRHSRMEFLRFDANTKLVMNKFGIREPDPASTPRIPARHLDLILLPLVAFDKDGWRLGSGAGFYDRRLSHLRSGRAWRRPKLVGIAYEFQRVERLEPHRWDIPLDAIVTDRQIHRVQLRRTAS